MGRPAQRVRSDHMDHMVATVIRPALQQALGAAEAARFLGIGETFFRSLVTQRRLPKPRVLGQRRLWDVDELAAAFKAIPHEDGDRDDSWDDWEPK